MWVSLLRQRRGTDFLISHPPLPLGFGKFSATVSASSKGLQVPFGAKVQAGRQPSSLPREWRRFWLRRATQSPARGAVAPALL